MATAGNEGYKYTRPTKDIEPRDEKYKVPGAFRSQAFARNGISDL